MVAQAQACPCEPCGDWRLEPGLSGGQTICFEDAGPGHGPCIDPWGEDCVCVGTAIDGECEGCWLWLK